MWNTKIKRNNTAYLHNANLCRVAVPYLHWKVLYVLTPLHYFDKWDFASDFIIFLLHSLKLQLMRPDTFSQLWSHCPECTANTKPRHSEGWLSRHVKLSIYQPFIGWLFPSGLTDLFCNKNDSFRTALNQIKDIYSHAR